MHIIGLDHLSIEELGRIWRSEEKIELSNEAISAIENCRAYLDKRMENQADPIYGINTGFGSLCNTKIENESLGQLQENLVKSHACGTGDKVDRKIVRLMILLKVKGLSLGYSGVQLATVQRLIDFYNVGVCPVIYEQGSLGASGDLAPLAHLSLPIIGRGEVELASGERLSGQELKARFGWQPVILKSKEGLALLNGTQFMSAFG